MLNNVNNLNNRSYNILIPVTYVCLFACLSPYSFQVFRCLSSTNVVGPGCVIGGFDFERTMPSRSQVKFLKVPWFIWIKVGECMNFNV